MQQFVGDGVRRTRTTGRITEKVDLGNGQVAYFSADENGPRSGYALRTAAGDLTASGTYTLPAPVLEGQMWVPAAGTGTELMEYGRAGGPLTVGNRHYDDTIEVIVTTGVITTTRVDDGKPETLAHDLHEYYARDVGLVLREAFVTPPGGARTLRWRQELVRYTPNPTTESAGRPPTPAEQAQFAATLRAAEKAVLYPPSYALPVDGAAPFTEEAAKKIDAAMARVPLPKQDDRLPLVDRLQLVVGHLRLVYREAGYDLDATIVRLAQEIEARRAFLPRSFAPKLMWLMMSVIRECVAHDRDCQGLFSPTAGGAIHTLVELERARRSGR
jgi:hypothetical protein